MITNYTKDMNDWNLLKMTIWLLLKSCGKAANLRFCKLLYWPAIAADVIITALLENWAPQDLLAVCSSVRIRHLSL